MAQSTGRPNTGSPSPAIDTTNQVPPVPPCPTYFELGSSSCPPTSYKDEPFDVPANGGGVDNGFVTIRLDWTQPDTDFDLEIYRDANGDGDLNDQNEDNEPENEPVASSATGVGHLRGDHASAPIRPRASTTRGSSTSPATDAYNARDDASRAPSRSSPAATETWRLTCESHSGTVLTSQDVLIARGERKDPNLTACTTALQPGLHHRPRL